MKKYIIAKIRPPIKCHGGKYYLARRIASLFPWHSVYVEPFLGGGSVLLNKRPSSLEIACDVNPQLMVIWNQLKRCNDQNTWLPARFDHWVMCGPGADGAKLAKLEESYLSSLLKHNTDYSMDAFLDAGEHLAAVSSGQARPDPVTAWAFLVRNRMSRGGLGKTFAWSERLRGKRSLSGPVPGELNSWSTFIEQDLPQIIKRIREVTFLT